MSFETSMSFAIDINVKRDRYIWKATFKYDLQMRLTIYIILCSDVIYDIYVKRDPGM